MINHPSKSRRFKIAVVAVSILTLVGGALAYAHQNMPRHGHFGGPGMEMHSDHVQMMLSKIGANDAQKAQIDGILKSTTADFKGAHEAHFAAFTRFHELLLAPNIDRAQLESLRVEQIRLADEESKRLVVAIANAAEVLTPEQRTSLAEQVHKHHGE